ncbi:protein kinase-like domain, Phloem protein 2-like protein [Artemisia annua]|uniref:non-specific serine/threonine protein kinase n=1 Tax=Artemisia annua TaxID=35608 RepID=A0A2U1PUB1_ARTAN|nr:protein kinase-like domain, Phloem protein 2-like protein [Artemisia annua]
MEGKSKNELPKRCSTVAIKQILNRQDEQGKEGFLAEIELLTSCKHQNIVSLLGFSSKDREMILVYEFLVNGSLDDYLGSAEKKINLTWNQRLQICLNIAEGLKYLHTSMEGKPRIIHRDIKSANVLLDENWNAKIADFGLSKFHPANQPASTIKSKGFVGTEVYMDPEYLTTGKYKKETDIYSFGVVLFEILSGTLAYDSVYLAENDKGLAPIARRRFSEGTLKELIDPTMMVEDNEQRFTLNRGPNQDSFDAFTKIAYQCLAETQAKRPPMEVIIKELRNAQKFQGETMVLYKVRHIDIVQATEDFKETYRIGFDAHGMVYKAELDQFESESSSSTEEKNKREEAKKHMAIKRILCREDEQGEQGFFEELEMCMSYKHPNIASLLGFCDEGREMIFVYEHACNGSLDDYLGSNNGKTVLTWAQRLHMCIEIACGLNHLHTKMGSKQSIIHGDIRSANILFGKNFEAKIAYFGVSNLHPANQEATTKVYLDPEYEITGKLGTKSDIYSFGVVLFEILCGKLAYDLIYKGTDKGLAPIARQRCNDRTIKKMIDRKLLVETDEDGSTANKGPNQDSLDTFLKIACQCLGETQTERPMMETVITELQKALNFQESLMRDLQISLENIKMATQEFNQENCVGSGRDWKVYKGELSHAKANANATGCTTIVAKQWIRKYGQENNQFRTELDILFNRKHEDIISLAGYCDEQGETIIVYKHSWNGSLDEHLNNVNLTWIKRLQICIDVASGLEFLHGGGVTQKKLVHGNIRSANILLTADWKAKISNFEFSSLDSLHQHMDHVSDNAYGTFAYLDPEYAKSGYLTDKSDLYSFGVILLEILCGRLALEEGCDDYSKHLGPLAKLFKKKIKKGPLAKRLFEERNLDEMIFEGIKLQIVPLSFFTFKKIAYECLRDDSNQRPEASEVVIQLKEALEFQMKHDEIKILKGAQQVPESDADKDQMHQMPQMPKEIEDTYNYDGNKGLWFYVVGVVLVEDMILHCLASCHRFQNVMELLARQVFRIKYKIESEKLSPFTEYACYLVFKLSEKCRELHCPVKVRDLLHRKIKETKTVYFRSPAPFNQHDGNSVPNQRADGWMEVMVWKFNSKYKLANNLIPMNLKLIAYEGTMSGLTICGMDFRPM